jgi:acyl-CoA reductase-like NAD-dependent aldehyde dehydrogenase
MKSTEIRKILLKAADIMESRIDELAGYQMEETGAPDFIVKSFNLPTTVEMFRDVAGRIGSIVGMIPQTQDGGALVFKESYGVILGIAPWNAPYILGLRAVIYALATGNTAILKGSELSPRCFWAIGSVFHEAGLPAGCLNVLYHRPQDAAAVTNRLIEANEIKKVNFTGSTAVGAIIAAKSGENLKPCLMELGGKASALVLDDADIENAAFQCALGAFVHAGQICMSTERIVVHKSILEPFSEALKGAIAKIYPDSGEAPILVARPAVEKNQKLVKDAVDKGAKLLYGDLNSKETNSHRLRPFVVQDVTKEMDLYYTESFGPSVSLLTVESDDQAVDYANDTEYGLSGAIFTKDLQRGIRLARQIDSGAIHINQMSVHDEAGLPHGGVKKSGWGRFNHEYGLNEFLKLKTVTFAGDW